MRSNTLILFITLTSNNVFITLTDINGNISFWITLGYFKLRGAKKLTFNSLKQGLDKIIFKSIFFNKILHIKFNGSNKYKKLILKYLKQSKLDIISINDITKKAHNGCKLQKKRRI